MPKFVTSTTNYQAIPDGTYLAKIVSAIERVSERGNEMIVMKLALPDGRTLPCVLTFVPQSKPVVNAFCDSAGLLKPAGEGVEVELKAEHCRGRYLYITVTNDVSDVASDPVPRVVRFLTREQALIKRPDLAQISIRPVPTLTLPTAN
jgi:hypothetical protein